MNFNTTAPRLTLETLSVPTEWGMFTGAGNRALKAKATTAHRKLLKLKAEGRLTAASTNRVLVAYIASWERSERSKGMSEAGDTDVREQVGDWHDSLAKASGVIATWDIHSLWGANRDAAYRLSRKAAKTSATASSAV